MMLPETQRDTFVLCADSIGKRFGRVRVLVAATLHVPAARITGLFGRNGSGKSTLMKIMTGRLRADHGFIQFNGHVFHHRPRLHLLGRAGLYYAPTEGALSRWLRFGDQLAAVCRHTGNESRAAQTIALFKLEGLLDRTPQSFSGGESRRAALALACARNPCCLISDEPLYGIDPNDREILLNAFRALADEGCAVLVTGHETPELLPACDRVAWLSGGSISMLGDGKTARLHHSFRRDYLG